MLVGLDMNPPTLHLREIGMWLIAAFVAKQAVGAGDEAGQGLWSLGESRRMVGRRSGLPCAIRDYLDDVHFADMQRQHLQDAKERDDES